MDPALIGSVLLVMGIVCLLLEIKIPGFFIAIPGTVMLLLGAMGLMMPGLLFTAVGPVLALTGAVGASVASIKFYKMLGNASAPPVTSTPEGLIGEIGVVARAIDKSGRGRVRIRGQVWSSTAYETLPEGTQILVIGADRGRLLVGEAPPDMHPRIAEKSASEGP